jgi:hypothetical protein
MQVSVSEAGNLDKVVIKRDQPHIDKMRARGLVCEDSIAMQGARTTVKEQSSRRHMVEHGASPDSRCMRERPIGEHDHHLSAMQGTA